MTRQEAKAKLIETRNLSTAMLEPLGISFETFLKVAQYNDETYSKVMDKVIAHLNQEDSPCDNVCGACTTPCEYAIYR